MIKKICLLLSLVGFTYPLMAQQAFDETFFSGEGPEDFTLGSINGQQGWISQNISGNTISGCNITIDVPLSVTADWTPSWPSSLSLGADQSFPATANATFGCYSPLLITPGAVTQSAEMSIMVLIDRDDDNATEGALYELVLFDGDNITSKIAYLPDGSIQVVDTVNGQQEYVDTNTTWTDHDWAQLTIRFNFNLGSIEYLINGVTIYEGSELTGQKLERLAILHDNNPGSTAYFDDIFVFGSPTAGTDTFEKKSFFLFPNPAQHEFMVENSDEKKINTIKILDINGRVIKNISLTAASDPKINVDDISAGTYLVTFYGDNFFDKKILVKQ